MRRLTFTSAILLAAAVLAPAQQPAPVTMTGFIGAGGRQVSNDTSSSKLTEYRDLADDAFVPQLTLNIFGAGTGWYFDFLGANVSLRDQTFSARGGRAGRWSLGFEWFDIPHNLSNKAQTPYIARGEGLLEVPATVPITFKKLNTVAGDAPDVVASDALIASYQTGFLGPTALATQTNLGRVTAEYAALEALKLNVAYDLRKKSGLRPSFGPIGDRPPRTLNIQLTEPVDYRTQDVTLSAEHVGRKYQAQFNYVFSDFSNRVDTLLWENIYTTAAPDSTFDVWDRAVSVFGRRPLAPDNRYHNLSFSVAREMPAESRLSATVALGLLDQNEQLLPYSYNSNLLASPALPRDMALAEMRTTQALVDYTINPVPRLSVKAWGRFYGMDNDTPEAPWQYVTSDTSNLNGTVSYKNKRINLAYASSRANTGIDATYRARPWRSSLSLGYEHEWITREYREADTGENRFTASFRARPASWANLRARYVFGDRDGTYDPLVTRRSYWYQPSEANDADNPGFTFSNHPDMRRYDNSDRRRNLADFTLTLIPGEAVSLAAGVRYRDDDFDSGVTPSRALAGTGLGEEEAFTPGTQLGLLRDKRLSYTFDADYTPAERLSLNAFLSLDRGTSSQRSLEFNENNKMNPSAVATAELGPWTRAGSQWTADFDDRTWTAGAGATLGLVPNRVSLSATYTLSLSNFDATYAGYGVVNFDGTPFPPKHQFAFPSRPPRVNQDLQVFDVRLEFPVVRNVSFLVGYSYERYRTDDWMQGESFPWVEPVGSEFLLRDTSRSHQWGNRLFNLGTFLAPTYNAHIGWVAFNYRF
jgi:hypothetical protein